MKKRSALLWASALAAGVLVGPASAAEASLPPGTTPVAVSSGAVHSGIDAAVRQYGAISGNIKSVAPSGGITTAVVYAYSGSAVAGTGFSDANGNYQINTLPTGSYKVCVNGAYASGGGSSTGYLSRCYKTAAWSGVGGPPSNAVAVSVTAGSKTSGINVSLPSAAAISGKVANAGGTGLNGVSVLAKNRDTGQYSYGNTNSTGSYKITGLAASSSGYTVCFDGSAVAGSTGYLDRCWKNIPWDGGALPSTATKVSVALGSTHAGIGATLARGGAIAGIVRDANTGSGLPGASVGVFNSSGKLLRSGGTDSSGAYTVKSLPAASKDFVCVYPFSTSTPTVLKKYKGRCYKTAAWSGGKLPSSGLTGVSVTQGSVHGKINFALPKTTTALGSIAGTIKSGTSGTPAIQGASVSVYTASGGFVNSATTDNSGAYKVTGLKANATGYVVCAEATYVFTPTPPATGWAPHCFANANWDGSSTIPAAATKVPLSAGQNKTGINVTLPVGGAVSGTVTVRPSTNGASVSVKIFNANTHQYVTSGSSSSYSSGSYQVTGLAGGYSYIVCFDGRYYTYDAATPYGTMPQCYNNVPWDGNG